MLLLFRFVLVMLASRFRSRIGALEGFDVRSRLVSWVETWLYPEHIVQSPPIFDFVAQWRDLEATR